MYLIIYKTSNNEIVDYFDEGVSCDHALEGATLRVVDSVLYGLDTSTVDTCHFSGTLPSDIDEKLKGDATDLDNIIPPQRGYYKMSNDLLSIEVA